MSYFQILPDCLYKDIYRFVFNPKSEIKRWDEKTSKWTDLQINRCHVCKAPSTKVALAHLCDVCNNDGIQHNGCCDNQLICFDCAH